MPAESIPMSHPFSLPASLQAREVSPSRRRLSTGAVPPDRRFEYWMDMICALYAQLECDLPKERDVFGDIEFSRLGSLDLTHLKSNARRVCRTPAQIRRSDVDCFFVQVQREGRGVVCQDGRSAAVAPGDFVVYDSTRPYELIFDEPLHEVLVLRLPRAQLTPHVCNLEDLTATTVDSSSAAVHLLLSMLDTLQRDVDVLHPSSVLGVSEAITSIIAAGLRSLPGANARKRSNLSAYHVARVIAYVQERLRDPALCVSTIAQAMKVSPDHLSRLFRSEPVPLSRLIWQQRLDACRRDLADRRLAERSTSEIAYSWGFNDAAHFSRSFREQFGVSPREWRHRSLDDLAQR
jgi:AraC-like DNA-binding protein